MDPFLDMDLDATFVAAVRRMETDIDRFWRSSGMQPLISDDSMFDRTAALDSVNVPALLPPVSDNNGPLVPFNSPSSSVSLDAPSAAMMARNVSDNRMLAVHNDAGNVRLRFNVGSFTPGEIKVTVGDDRFLRVHARHVDQTPNRSVVREFRQEYLLPPDAIVENMNHSLDEHGILAVDIPREADEGPLRIMNN